MKLKVKESDVNKIMKIYSNNCHNYGNIDDDLDAHDDKDKID